MLGNLIKLHILFSAILGRYIPIYYNIIIEFELIKHSCFINLELDDRIKKRKKKAHLKARF